MTCKHIFNSDEGTSHCTLAGVTAEQWQAMKTELSQLRAEREGLLDIAGVRLPDNSTPEFIKGAQWMLDWYSETLKSHLTRTEQKEGV